MKVNEAPEKIYVHEASAPELTQKLPYHIEYIRTDSVIEWIKNKADKYIVDTPICYYFDYKRAVEDFKDYIKGE